MSSGTLQKGADSVFSTPLLAGHVDCAPRTHLDRAESI